MVSFRSLGTTPSSRRLKAAKSKKQACSVNSRRLEQRIRLSLSCKRIVERLKLSSRILQVFFAFNSSVLDQGLPKGGHYSRSTTALVLWTLRVDTRSKGGLQEWFF
jgi:hypothetical protein